jgi:subtilisin family serine protease
MKRAVSGVCAAILCTIIASAAFGQSAPLVQKSPDAAEVTRIAQERGFVRVIVQFDRPASATQVRPDAASIQALRSGVAAAQDQIISSHFGSVANPSSGQGFGRGLTRFETTPGFAVNVAPAELNQLAADPRVMIINFDRAVPPTLIQSVPLIGMPQAYNLGATGQGQIVAVLDTGAQLNHEFLAGKIVAEACFSAANGGAAPGEISLCPDGSPTQVGSGASNAETAQCINGNINLCEHGTHVAGIAAGFNTNLQPGEPPNGVAKSANLFPIQVFTRFNTDARCGGAGTAPCVASFTSDQVRALDYLFTHINIGGGNVASANMSLGGGLFSGTCDDAAQKPAIDNLRSAGILVAIASGNNGSKTQISSPGCISTAVTVGSTTKADAVSFFSNMSDVVDLLAPGGDVPLNPQGILSSVPVVPSSTTAYAYFIGTSMAAPHVAGAIAAIRAACPQASAGQIENALKSTGIPVTDTRSGAPTPNLVKPRIRVDLAVQQLNCTGVTTIVAAVAPNARTTTVGTPVTGFATILNAGGATALGCSIILPSTVPASFSYQTTNSQNVPVGSPNTPADIGPSQGLSFVFSVTPTAPFVEEIALIFKCANASPAPLVFGLTTFLVTAGTAPLPDMLSIADTLTHNGIAKIPGTTGTGLIVTAAIDIGAGGIVTVAATATPVGQPTRSLAANLFICQTNSSGACINPPTPGGSSTVNVSQNETVFFSVFIQGQGVPISYDPGNTRVFVVASQGSNVVGEASAAVCTSGAAPPCN